MKTDTPQRITVRGSTLSLGNQELIACPYREPLLFLHETELGSEHVTPLIQPVDKFLQLPGIYERFLGMMKATAEYYTLGPMHTERTGKKLLTVIPVQPYVEITTDIRTYGKPLLVASSEEVDSVLVSSLGKIIGLEALLRKKSHKVDRLQKGEPYFHGSKTFYAVQLYAPSSELYQKSA
ncbi:MAG: hypothetical protein WC595_01595 [Candidatus Nanoarchaeia archaeon]